MTPRSKPSSCFSAACPLCSHGSDFTQPEGLGLLKVCVVAEASGDHEAREGLPLRPFAPSGGVFERTIRRLGYSRDQFVITNTLRCKPTGNLLDGMPYEREAIAACRPNLLAVIRQFKPKVLLALGNVPFRALTGISGVKQSISHMRGYAFRALPEFCDAAGIDNLVVVPTFHPAFLRRGAIHLTGVFARDIQRAVNIAAGRDKSFILDMPLLDTSSADDPFAAESEKHDATTVQASISSWMQENNLNYILKPTRQQLDQFCRDAKSKSDAWAVLSTEERKRSLLALSWDLETMESANLDEDESDGFSDTRISLFQASTEPRSGVAMDWRGEHIQAARWLLKLPLPNIFHNGYLFDYRVLKAVGKRDFGDVNYLLPVGPQHDTLQMFHDWQPDLAAHLQSAASFVQFEFPWKHLNGDNLEFYGVADVDSALRIFHTVRRTMIDRGIWEDHVPGRNAAGYINQVEAVRPILAKMEDRGFPVDNERRLALDKDFAEAEAEALAELDRRFPDECRKVLPREKGRTKGYSDVPPELKELFERVKVTDVPEFIEVVTETVAKDGTIKQRVSYLDEAGEKVTKKFKEDSVKAAFRARWDNVTEAELAVIRTTRFQEPPDADDYEGELIRKIDSAGNMIYLDSADEPVPSATYFYDLRECGAQALDDGLMTTGSMRWCRVYQFSPNSSAQLMAYMRARKHQIPTKKTGESTTGKLELQRVSAKYKDNFYLKVIEFRELNKARSTFIDGFKPQSDGMARTTFTFAPATKQLSSRAPVNFQNVPKNGKLAKAIRGIFRCADGRHIVEWDFKSYHALTTGFNALSKNYMRMSKLDIHSFLGWHFLRLPDADKLIDMTDGELLERFKWFKSDPKRKQVREKQAKPTAHGVNFGLGVRKLYDMNREHFESEKQARQLRQMIENLFPEVFRWQGRIRDLAHQQGFLKNRFNAIRWFYEIFIPDGKGGWRPGEQSEQALAFLPASEAFGNIRESMKELEREGLNEKWSLSSTVHDSLIFLVAPDRLEEHIGDVYPILHAPSTVLVEKDLAPGGLIVDCECSSGVSWADVKEVEIPEWVVKKSEELNRRREAETARKMFGIEL